MCEGIPRRHEPPRFAMQHEPSLRYAVQILYQNFFKNLHEKEGVQKTNSLLIRYYMLKSLI